MANKCLHRKTFKQLPDPDNPGQFIGSYDITCYDSVTGLQVPCEQCVDCCPSETGADDVECRKIKVGYDNGITPGSSSNDCGSRPNFIRFNWDMEVVSWEVNGQLYGAGHQFTGITGWTPQLQAWADFFNLYNPNHTSNGGCAEAAFGFKPSPTWRFTEITDCDPRVVYGPLILRRLSDGCIFTVYPIDTLKEDTINKFKRLDTYDCDTQCIESTYFDINTGKEVEPECCPKCFVPCGYKFEDYTSGESPCVSNIYDTLCDKLEDDTLIPYVIILTDCGTVRSREVYTLDSYLNAATPDDLVEYTPVGTPVDCNTGLPFEEPDPPIEECTKVELCYPVLKTEDACFEKTEQLCIGLSEFSGDDCGNDPSNYTVPCNMVGSIWFEPCNGGAPIDILDVEYSHEFSNGTQLLTSPTTGNQWTIPVNATGIISPGGCCVLDTDDNLIVPISFKVRINHEGEVWTWESDYSLELNSGGSGGGNLDAEFKINYCHTRVCYLGKPSEIIDCGTGLLANLDDLDEIDCDSIKPNPILDKLCEIADLLVVEDCETTCESQPFCVRGFDYQDLETWEDGSMEWVVNGNASIDQPSAQDNGNKSSWYTNLIANVNSNAGWSMTVAEDTSSTNQGDKVVFQFVGPCASELVAVRNGGDTLTITVDADGVATGTFTENGNDICSDCFPDCPSGGGGNDDPIGDPTICASRKIGADFNSALSGTATHTLNSLYDTDGPLIAWNGTFVVTDSSGTNHTFANGQTMTGLSSGATQQVSYTGLIHWSDGTNEYKCNVTDKLISANFTVL